MSVKVRIKCVQKNNYDNLLIVGNTYTGETSGDHQYYIEEINRFRSIEYFVDLESLRELKLKELGI